MTEPLYKIEEMQTDGWRLPHPNCDNLTKKEAMVRYDELVNFESMNPNRLRISRDNRE